MMSGSDPAAGSGPSFRTVEQGQGNAAPPMQGNIPAAHPQQVGMTAVPTEKIHTWNFSHFSQVENKQYDGQFSCKKMSIMELSRLGVRKTQLNGGFHFDETKPGAGIEEHIDSMNSMIAHLEISIIQAPVWFNLDFVYDPELLQLIYNEVAKFENSFFRRQRSAPESGQGGPDDRRRESEESGTAGHIAAVGGGEVPPSMDP